MDIVCKKPKPELEHGADYNEGKLKVQNYKKVASAHKKKSDACI